MEKEEPIIMDVDEKGRGEQRFMYFMQMCFCCRIC